MMTATSNVSPITSRLPARYALPSSIMASALVFAGKKHVRFYLNGVHIEANGMHGLAIATDGHICGVHRLSFAEPVAPCSMTIPREVLDGIRTLAKLDSVLLEKADGADMYTLVAGGASYTFAAIDATYPDYRPIIPAECSGEAAQFDPDLVMRFQKAAKLRGFRNVTPHIRHNGLSTALVTHEGDTDFLGLLMPMRFNAPEHDLSWAFTPIL